ncbi:MAG: HAMP domain-containing sensor histidine kinase [Bacteroidota bacterium]|nr:HAMP domain-containing sensor histidine kinase [Bacteroidota bacterium]
MPIPLYGILIDIIADVRSSLARNTDDPGTEGSVIINLLPESLDARIQADLSFLPGVFKNVIKNAAEHVLETSPNPVVTESCTADDATVTVDVHNGGDLVPPERLATFFDRFNSTKLEQGGTGLGTTYARIVTEAHGGSISVSSSAEDGTQVRISLPRVVS